MKKTLLFIISFILILSLSTSFTSCSSTDGNTSSADSGVSSKALELSSATSVPTKSEVKEILSDFESFWDNNFGSFIINISETWDTKQWVAKTPELKAQLLDALSLNTWEPTSWEGLLPLDTVVIEGGAPFVSIEVHSDDENTIISVHTAEDTLQFSTSPEVFPAVLALLEESLTVPKESMEGEFIPLESAGFSWENRSIVQILEFPETHPDRILVHLEDPDLQNQEATIEIFSTETGESLYYHVFPEGLSWVQHASWKGSDFRLVDRGGNADYRSLDAPEETIFLYEFPVKAERKSKCYLSPHFFDSSPETETVIWAERETGVWLSQQGSDGKLILDNDVGREFLGEDAAYFGSPRLLNNGTIIITPLCLTGAQPFFNGLMLYDIQTETAFFYDDVFSTLLGGVTYPSDTTVIAHAIDRDTFIHVDTFTHTVKEKPEGTEEYSLVSFYPSETKALYQKTVTRDTGEIVQEVSRALDQPPFFYYRGESGEISVAGEYYAIFSGETSDGSEMSLLEVS